MTATVNSRFHQLWPTVLLEQVMPDAQLANEVLQEFILRLETEHQQQLTTDYRTQNFLNHDNPAVQWLRQCINKSVADYLTDAGMNYKVDWTIQGWANINRQGDYHSPHNHPHSYLSGTYYVNMPEQPNTNERRDDLDPAAISFFDPRAQANMTAIAADRQVDPEFKLLPSAGLMLLWPSFLHHFVHPNLSIEPRISISFNIVLKWNDAYIPEQ